MSKIEIKYSKSKKTLISESSIKSDGNFALKHLDGFIMKYKLPADDGVLPKNFELTNFAKDLEALGYDISTLKFSIDKLK